MSTKIELRIQTGIDLDLFDRGIVVRLVRLITRVRFQTDNGWTRTAEAIVDTGSVVSILPYFAWKNANTRILSSREITLRGLAPQKEATLQAKIAEVVCTFHDRHRISPPLKIKAYLLPDDSVPLIIGFEDVLTTAKLVSDYKNNIAYLEF